MGAYTLRCLEGGHIVHDEFSLMCEQGHKGLLRSEYAKKKLDIIDCKSLFRFYDWLPVHSTVKSDSAPVVFRNEAMAKELGLEDLWIGFTGYYPERGAYAKSCTFKELEALPTFARLKDMGKNVISLASAGNTARAFAQVAEDTGNKVIIVVPKKSADRIKVTEDTGKTKLITVDGDYTDAIRISDRIAKMGVSVSEGGARNVARRDGMGTVMLQAAITAGKIPDYYFQGVGSGTGAISAWEASMRLNGDGRFGSNLPELHLAQNIPFTPMAKAWGEGRRSIIDEDLPKDKGYIDEVYADVLTNRTPPYGMAGGVFDAMTACKGRFYEVSREAATDAEKFWCSFEDVRPDPAASVAFAALMNAVEECKIDSKKKVFVNMTGGGLERAIKELSMVSVKPTSSIKTDITDEELRGIVNE
ncbi:MAG: cysteate synthase [Candidatus Methanomethylophilaceae archaeon]|nr:cysteate synthase [Candidatus Methanomethylophilaceae archaeon]MDD3378863.1 cysteate synthase [Candidatus Methanomethylophilaceae archaeon]MDY0224102.1 cysteate synthase [Candidatus Methanomethylophilaceae archaeon]